MTTNSENDNVFIIVSLFLLAVISVMLIIQLIVWSIIVITAKKTKIKLTNKTYETLLISQDYQDVKVKKVKLAVKFANYHKQNNCLKLSNRNFEEKTTWNIYQNLVNILLIKWKKTNRKTNIILILSTLIFYLSVIATITLSLIYYINLAQKTINQIDTNVISILSFIVLIFLVLSWLLWTMSYEKLRKEVIQLTKTFDNQNLLKMVKRISGYKTLFPGSELLF